LTSEGKGMSSSLILFVPVLIFVVLSVRVVGEHERLVIERLGVFIGIRGPGMVWVLPFLDKATRINLDRDIPNWRSLSTEQLAPEIQRRLTTSRQSQ
jgi:regulator of protease activity HflC (stomatin/prohibitin superfamily)